MGHFDGWYTTGPMTYICRLKWHIVPLQFVGKQRIYQDLPLQFVGKLRICQDLIEE